MKKLKKITKGVYHGRKNFRITQTHIIATNSAILVNLPHCAQSVTLNNEFVDVELVNIDSLVGLIVQQSEDGKTVTFTDTKKNVTTTAMVSSRPFPDFEQIIPATPETTLPMPLLDPAALSVLLEVIATTGIKKIHIISAGDNRPVKIMSLGNIVGFIMPMRS